MGRTVGIAVGCAGAYIVLVIGLMIYCRSRRSRMLKNQGELFYRLVMKVNRLANRTLSWIYMYTS